MRVMEIVRTMMLKCFCYDPSIVARCASFSNSGMRQDGFGLQHFLGVSLQSLEGRYGIDRERCMHAR